MLNDDCEKALGSGGLAPAAAGGLVGRGRGVSPRGESLEEIIDLEPAALDFDRANEQRRLKIAERADVHPQAQLSEVVVQDVEVFCRQLEVEGRRRARERDVDRARDCRDVVVVVGQLELFDGDPVALEGHRRADLAVRHAGRRHAEAGVGNREISGELRRLGRPSDQQVHRGGAFQLLEVRDQRLKQPEIQAIALNAQIERGRRVRCARPEAGGHRPGRRQLTELAGLQADVERDFLSGVASFSVQAIELRAIHRAGDDAARSGDARGRHRSVDPNLGIELAFECVRPEQDLVDVSDSHALCDDGQRLGGRGTASSQCPADADAGLVSHKIESANDQAIGRVLNQRLLSGLQGPGVFTSRRRERSICTSRCSGCGIIDPAMRSVRVR